MSDENRSDIKQPTHKSLWFETNRKEFEELTGDIYNNQDNNDFKIIINKRTYDLKNAKKSWMEVTTCKISKSEAKKLYSELIQGHIDTLMKEKSNDTRKYNILNVLDNIDSIFTGTYLHYKDVSKQTMFKSVAERTKLRRQKFDEIKRKEQNVSN